MNREARVFLRRHVLSFRVISVIASIAALGALADAARGADCLVEIFVEPAGDCCGEDVCFPTLQEAFDVAEDGDCIRIAEGGYAAAELDLSNAAVRIDSGWDACFTTLGEEAVSITDAEIDGRTTVTGLTVSTGTLRIGDSLPAACTTIEATVTVTYDSEDGEASGITARFDYPEAVSLPGSSSEPSVLERVENVTGASGIFSASDNDGDPADPFFSAGLVSIPGPIPAGPFVKVEFDCEDGLAPEAEEFPCVSQVSDGNGNLLPSSCAVSLVPIL